MTHDSRVTQRILITRTCLVSTPLVTLACRWALHIVDTNPNSLSARGWLEDTSKVQKYTMTDAEYRARDNTYWKYKEQKLKVGVSFPPAAQDCCVRSPRAVCLMKPCLVWKDAHSLSSLSLASATEAGSQFSIARCTSNKA